jgi:uncharacterized membrane protein YfcA
MIWLACIFILLAGAAIGACSIGGVLIVPALSRLAGVPLPEAVAASSLAFAFTGLIGWRSGTEAGLSWRTLWPLYGAALLAALGGATMVHVVDPSLLRAWVALLTIASGVYALASRPHGVDQSIPGALMQGAVGIFVGFGSSFSGTGGPVLLLPILLFFRVPTMVAIAISQSIQLPIAIAASTGHALRSDLPFKLGIAIGVALLIGAWFGRRAACRMSPAVLRAGTSIGLIVVGIWYAIP